MKRLIRKRFVLYEIDSKHAERIFGKHLPDKIYIANMNNNEYFGVKASNPRGASQILGMIGVNSPPVTLPPPPPGRKDAMQSLPAGAVEKILQPLPAGVVEKISSDVAVPMIQNYGKLLATPRRKTYISRGKKRNKTQSKGKARF